MSWWMIILVIVAYILIGVVGAILCDIFLASKSDKAMVDYNVFLGSFLLIWPAILLAFIFYITASTIGKIIIKKIRNFK